MAIPRTDDADKAKAKDGPKPGVLVSLVSGGIAGAVAKSTIAPLDRTKIYFQTSHHRYSWRAAYEFILSRVATEGVKGLWRGNSATMCRIAPYAAVQYTAHEYFKTVLGIDHKGSAGSHPLLHLLAGSLAGVTSQSATYPLDVARARMAVSTELRASLNSTFRHMWTETGFRALYRGYVVTVLGVIPYAGVSFFTYETLKGRYLETYGRAASGLTSLMFGGIAGVVAQTTSYPLDIVRRRMQVSPGTIRQVYTQVFINEGWRGFFKGLSMNWVKGPIAVGISFSTYDQVKSMLLHVTLAMDKTWS